MCIEVADDLEEFFLRGFRRELDFHRMESEVGTGAGFRADVNFGRGVVADEDDGKAGPDALGEEFSGFCAAFVEDGGGYGFSIEDFR